MQSKLFISWRSEPEWARILEALDVEYHTEYSPCDIAVVLGGKMSNPLCFKKKILITSTFGWSPSYIFYKDILTEYYDEIKFIDGLNLEEVKELIEGYFKQ